MNSLLRNEEPSILFARIIAKTKERTNKFIYCGELDVESFDNGANNLRPFGVKFTTKEIPKEIPQDLSNLINWKPENNSSLVEAENLASTHTLESEADINKSEGQGIITNQRLKKAIEDYAMEKLLSIMNLRATRHLTFLRKKIKGMTLNVRDPVQQSLWRSKGLIKMVGVY